MGPGPGGASPSGGWVSPFLFLLTRLIVVPTLTEPASDTEKIRMVRICTSINWFTSCRLIHEVGIDVNIPLKIQVAAEIPHRRRSTQRFGQSFRPDVDGVPKIDRRGTRHVINFDIENIVDRTHDVFPLTGSLPYVLKRGVDDAFSTFGKRISKTPLR